MVLSQNSSPAASSQSTSARSSVSSTLGSASIINTPSLNINSLSLSNIMYIGVYLDRGEAIIYPNEIIKGTVKVITSKVIYASQIRVKFRCLERAIVKVKDTESFSKLNRIEKIVTTYFDVESNVLDIDSNAYSINGWKIIEPGEHEFRFALKMPNINFLPSIETPIGLSIRYIWTAFLDGPANHPSIRSDDLITTYRPLLCCPSPNIPWNFRENFFTSKKVPIASMIASLPSQVFYPEQQFSLELALTSITVDMTITGATYALRQYFEGRVQLPHGIVRPHFHRDIMRHKLLIPPKTTNSDMQFPDVNGTIPSRWVPPCFSSNSTRMYYAFVIVIHVLTPGFFGTVEQIQAVIPIGMANMDQNQWGRVYNIHDYRQSCEGPFFFDPLLDEPPESQEEQTGSLEVDINPRNDSEMHVVMTDPLLTTANNVDEEETDPLPPPSYASLQLNLQQRRQHQTCLKKRERVEKTICSSQWVKAGMIPELGDALIVESVLYDEY